MESQERPAKMRKLQHGEEKDDPINLDSTAATTKTNAQPTPITDEIGNLVAVDQTPQTEGTEPKLSKSALKKKRRLEEWEAGRESRKIKRREKTKERKERKREAWKEDHVDEDGNIPRMPPSRLPRHTAGLGTLVPITVIFDCDFEDLMYDNELKSLGQQITRCYSDNRKAKYRTHLALSSFGGKMKERFDNLLAHQYTSWKGFHFFEEDFVAVAEKSKEWMTGPQGGTVAGALLQSKEHDDEQHDGQQNEEGSGGGEIIYLSSESDNILTHLKPNSTYIIGGLVDKNRHKGVCHKRAVNRGIKTAKLPIKEYLEMRDRQVLVTNHVMEILLKWMECGDWGKAFMEVIPQRKGGKLREDGGPQATESPEVEGQKDSEMVEAAEEAEKDAEKELAGEANAAVETEVIEVTKHLPVEDTEDD